jgi:RHS repeat-associated protein
MIPTAHTDLFNQSEGIKAYGSYEGDDVGNRTAVTQLTLPDGRSLRFHYNQYGEVAELVYPGGGVSQIDYDGFGSTVCEANTPIRIGLNRRVKQRRSLADGGNVDAVWIYNRTTETINSVNYPAVTVEAHQGSPTGTLLASSEHIFYELDKEDRICGSPTVTGTGNEHWQNAKEFRTITTSESGTMTVEHEWQQRAAIIWANDVGLSYNTYQQEHGIYAAGNDPRLVREDTTIENGLVKRVTFDYDNLNNVIATNEYDFGASPGTIGNSIRQTVRTYGTTQSGNFGISLNGNCYSNLNPGDSTCGNGLATDVSSIIHQTNLLQNQTINEIVNGSPSQRAYSASEYDKYTSQPNAPPFGLNSGMVHYDGTQFSAYASANQPRGNVTRTSRWIGGSSYLDSYAQYDNAGNVIWSKDPKGYESSISYTDNFGDGSNPDSPGGGPNGVTFAFPTIVTNPLGHQATTQYNYTLGAPTAVKDPNGVIARTEYDAAGRPFRVTSAVGLSAQTISEMTYPTASSNVATTSRQLDASRWLASKTVMDGFDRSVTSWQAEDGHKADAASFTIESNTVYDALGRASQVTNPYRPNDLNDQPRSTTTQYDLAGRVKVVITPDSAQITTLYNGNEVTVTDQDGKQRRSVTDGLGRLRKVYEAPNGVNYLTSYDYDVQDDLTTVTQGGQTRTFVYDPLKRLMSATNPECGTVCYGTRDEHGCVADGYDANGNLIHKTDARGVLTTYDYDALNRVVSRTYSDGTPNVTYGYDATTVAYAKGRRTSVTSSISSYSYIEYDPVGQVKSARQTTDAVDYNMSYTYNLAGGMISQSYPSGRIVGTEFDNAGRIAGVENATTGAFYQGGASTDATNRLQYNAMGAVTAARLGNGLWEHAVFNARLQTTQIGLGTSSANSSVLQLDYGYGTTNNNGNLKSQTITLPDGTALTQTYSYDALNRLTSATEINGGTQTWKQGFKYEDDSGQYGQFGNRRIDAANTTASLITENPLFDPNTNRIQPQGGEHYHYDPAGNLDTDKVGNTFSYDADNKQKEYNGGWQNGGATYIYDGDGHRVKKLTGNTTTVFVYNILGELVAEYSDATSVGSGGTNYLTADNLGTPRVVTGQNSNVISRHDYLPFGEELGAGTGGRTTAQGYPTGPGADGVRQQFTQKERDNETGLDYFGARYFASAQGRFTSADPVFMNGERRFSPQDINLYAYCGNNPLTHIDPDGRYYVGTDGKKVKVTVDASGNVHVGKNANSSLKRYAQLVNQAGSGEAVSAMLQVANNATRVHFKISPEVEHTKEGNLLFGLHQAHDKNGKALDWDSVAGTFKGKAAFITGRDGGTEYKEATITIYEGSIKTEAGTNYLRAELGDPKLTTNEAIVTTGAHEDTHDIDKASIGAIKDRQEGKANPLNVEAPAEEVEKKTADEIRKNRKPE